MCKSCQCFSETPCTNRIPIAYERGDDILYICNQPSLIGFNIASGPVEQYKSKISSKLLANSESWIGLYQSHVDRLKKVQDDYNKKMIQESNYGTMNCLLQLESQTLKIKWKIIQRKIRQVRKIMDKKVQISVNRP